MATTVKKYVSKCEEIVVAQPEYELGKSSLTKCDCIGMSKYSFRENNVSFSTSGTNYSVRNQVDGLRKITSTADLKVGYVVFKAREPGDSGYSLPEKYRAGGREYNGDLRDYYHIGTVKSVSPLQIIHMTTPTAKVDTSIGKWGYVARWKKEYISDYNDPQPAPEPTPTPDPEYRYVHSGNGKPVNMRKSPSLNAALVDRVPDGDRVEWLKEDGAGWAYIQWKGKYGWMLDCYLELEPEPSPPEPSPDPEPYPGAALTVWADNGLPVKLRARPSTSCKIYDLVPCGETVYLVSPGENWCRVDYKTRKGWYMMTKFLKQG